MKQHSGSGSVRSTACHPFRRRIAMALAFAAACGTVGTAAAQSQQSKSGGTAVVDAIRDPIPGPRNCFWSRGPVSADPYINIAYPDAGTFYWGATFSIPEGARLSMEGNFPHSRYMSLISYDAAGVPVESVADYLIKPAAGAVNPFLPGANRNAKARGYSLDVLDAAPPADQPVGMNLLGQQRSILHAPKYGPGQQQVLYRIYARDKGVDETGGVGLPVPVLTLADGRVLRGDAACPALRTRQPLQIDPAALAVPMEKYHELVATAREVGKEKHQPAFPATSPPTWFIQYDREYLYSLYTGKPLTSPKKSTGGFYPNLDNQYIRTIVNRKLGKVFVIRAKAPTTPRTANGDAVMGTGELRYWSMCSNQGFANTRVNGCVYDEQVPVGPDGFYTIVVSRKEDRPRNATTQCGIAWLPMADDGDGAEDADVTVVQLRHMLGTTDFPHAVQAISKPGDERKVMGDYYPAGRYMSTSAFEIAVPCMQDKH
ncbi:hypothetical protein [Cupriavidus metallidurans]|uniref:hypothetical protein n=1 Tax=Cupriavidus metallidurans TaxID=119219 RepID=UPI000A8248F0|nr:hypothetical protein [Cupriavidus metallidurans]